MRWFSAEYPSERERVVAAWKDAQSLALNPELLGMLLDIAREQVIEYAPAEIAIPNTSVSVPPSEVPISDGGNPSSDEANSLDGGTPAAAGPPASDGGAPEGWFYLFQDPPARYVWAQLQHAKTLWNAGRVTSSGEVGGDGFTFAPRPLDREIQRIIRPRTGVASVF